jgi:primosomal protein N' (replication factor Y) (superfamily II helicase)
MSGEGEDRELGLPLDLTLDLPLDPALDQGTDPAPAGGPGDIEADVSAVWTGLDGAQGPSETAGFVDVAVDAPGASRTYTYMVPARLADIEDGEAVLVEFGRGRQALGVVMGRGAELGADGRMVDAKPVLARVRADGPLLPSLSLAFARWIWTEYLAPPAAVLRSMLPPGMLERLDLVAEWLPEKEGGVLGEEPIGGAELALRDRLAAGPLPVPELEGDDGRAATLRRLRSMAARGLLRLEWTLTAATAGPRYERWLVLTDDGRGVATGAVAGGVALAAPAGVVAAPGGGVASSRLGPRQRALLADLAATGPEGLSGPEAAQRHGSGTATSLIRRGLIAAEIREKPRRPLEHRRPGRRGTRPEGAALTEPQAAALASIVKAAATHDPTPLLLEGITGSGKTTVYAEAIAEVISGGRPALVLVPEIALAMPLVDRLRADLDAEIAILHSGLGEGERADEWRRIRSGAVDVVVGTRIALTAPLHDLGLIVVDEEHDAAYKSDRTPRIQARDAAISLARIAAAALVLGSATPSVESVGRAREGTYRHATLPDRPSGAPPRIQVVDLRAELAAGNRGLLSDALRAGLDSLPAGEQAILVINRRGTASVVVCRDCGHVQRCPECDRSLVYHQAGVTLRCHHCGTASPLATRCPVCRSPRIKYLGGGTQRVEEEVKSAFPHLRIGRLDRDVAEHKGAVERVLDAFSEGRLDVLVGTSLVAKGIDVPQVTLVGVVSADVALNLPDERAAERTFQLLTQAVGRAGRGERPGLAIIQTYQPDHPAIQAVARGDASAFYDSELQVRRLFGSPPFGRLIKLTVGLPDSLAAQQEAAAMADRLSAAASSAAASTAGRPVAVLGPAPAYVARRAGRWRWNVVLRGDRPRDLIDPPPGAPWSVDVDPDSLL